MKTFVVHRGYLRSEARKAANSVTKTLGFPLDHTILARSLFADWKKRAGAEIETCEVVLVHLPELCNQSENTTWELVQAKHHSKPIVHIFKAGISKADEAQIKAIYHYDLEFETCFGGLSDDKATVLEQYKIMVQSSEDLIQRRQLTNGFFTTLLSGLMAASGFVFKEGVVTSGQYLFFLVPTFAGLVLCRSWWRLIDNYGKLNRGKYRVIQRLEEVLGARMFAAEWLALGNDKRPEKYRSFTKTEGSVPLLFAVALALVGLGALLSNDWTATFGFMRDLLRL